MTLSIQQVGITIRNMSGRESWCHSVGELQKWSGVVMVYWVAPGREPRQRVEQSLNATPRVS